MRDRNKAKLQAVKQQFCLVLTCKIETILSCNLQDKKFATLKFAKYKHS